MLEFGQLSPDHPKILLVEDEYLIQLLITTELKAQGYSVLEASTGGEALSILDEGALPIRGLVTDVNLGRGENGWVIARRARELYPHIAIVYMTGAAAAEWQVLGAAGSTLVTKPFMPEEVISALAEQLGSPSAMKRL